MIYIVGKTFQFNSRNSALGRSLQEQLALSKRGPTPQAPRTSSIFDDRFIPGHVYKVARISKIQKDNEVKVQYLFANQTLPTAPDIDVLLADTNKGDEYIAAMAGTAHELQEERKNIIAHYENLKDL